MSPNKCLITPVFLVIDQVGMTQYHYYTALKELMGLGQIFNLNFTDILGQRILHCGGCPAYLGS